MADVSLLVNLLQPHTEHGSPHPHTPVQITHVIIIIIIYFISRGLLAGDVH